MCVAPVTAISVSRRKSQLTTTTPHFKMVADEDEDVSDVFAIPDFWKGSRWLQTAADDDRNATVFTLDVNSTSHYHLNLPQIDR
jgi:hypothetical protein